MSPDFSRPQRQSAAGIIINSAYSIQQVIRAVFIPLIFFIIKANKVTLLYVGFGLAGVLLLSILYGYLYYLKFTFFLHPLKREFIIDKGVLSKKQLTIPLEKIQQVNINQGFLQKLIGVYSLEIDTAGSDKKEVNIHAIDGKTAQLLKAHLLHGELNTQQDNQDDYTAPIIYNIQAPFIKIDSLTLLKIGLTTNYGQSVALLIGLGYAIFHNIKEFLKAINDDRGQVEQFFASGFSLISIAILFLVLLFILLATNVIRTFIKYFDFQITKHLQSLQISAGLFAKKNTLLSPNKVQITAYSQNYFQKKIGLFNMGLKQAHAGQEQSDKEMKNSNLEIPGCSALEKEAIIKMILGKLPEKTASYQPNFRFMNLPILFKLLFPLGLYAISCYYWPQLRAFFPLALLYLPLVAFMIYISYTKHRLSVSEAFIIKRKGIWDISHEIIEPHKIQSISTSQYLWHRALDIGHVTLHTAAGSISFSYGNFSEIKTLVNWWLYQIESGQKDWM